MRKNKRGERDFFKKMENGELNEEKRKEPKLLIGKLNDNWIENDEDHSRDIKSDVNIERMHAAKEKRKEPKLLIGKLKDNWIENDEDHSRDIKSDVNIERMHAAKECKASSVLNKFKEMEKRVANGE